MMKKSVCVMLFVLLLPAFAAAQQKGSIELKSVAEVELSEKNEKGEAVVRREDAGKVRIVPGTTVIFTTTYTNIGKQQATGVVITNPVPEHVAYVDRSAEGKGTKIEYSADGGKAFGAPDKLTVKDAQGKARPAGASDYTHIKWTLTKPLPPGGQGGVSFRAKVK